MLNVLLCILILAVLVTGSYFAAQYIVTLRTNYKMLTDEHNSAVEYIHSLEDEIKQLTFEREQNQHREQVTTKPNGWDNFGIQT